MDKKYKYLIISILIVSSFIAFGRILGNDFVNFDDNVYITENNHIKAGLTSETIKWAFSAIVSSNWHPLTLLSHALDWSLFGANPSGHHFVNLLLHIGAVLFLFLFLTKTTRSLWPSAFVAAIFALHPLRVESVAWAAERKDVLSMFFGMAAIYAYALYVEDRKLSRYFLCLILFALGLMAKPMLVTLPFIMLLLDYWPLQRWPRALVPATIPATVNKGSEKKKAKQQRRADPNKEKKISTPLTNRYLIIRSLLWEKAPFIFLTIASSIVTVWAQSKGGAVASTEQLSFLARVPNAIMAYTSYIYKIFWPANLAVFYPYKDPFLPLPVAGALLILIVMTALVIYAAKKLPFLFVGWFWYLGSLIPVIGLVQVGRQAMADRYTYLPSIGIAIMLTWGILYLLPKEKLRRIILIPAAIIVLAVLSFFTWQQCGYWKNSVSLYNHALEATEDNDLAHYNLANTLIKQGMNKESIVHFRQAIKINPFHDSAYCNLGVALAAEGKREEATANYLEAIKINPANADAHFNIANLLWKQGQSNQAIGHYLEAVRINPDYADAHYNLAEALVKQGKIDQAIEHFREAVRINPSSFASLNNLGVNLEKQLKHDEAITCYRRALLIEPQNPGVHFNLGVALGNKGDLSEAIEHFREAIRLKPDYEEARRALNLAYPSKKKRKDRYQIILLFSSYSN